MGASIDYNRDRLYWTFVRQPIITRMLTSGGAAFERIAQSPAAEQVTDQEMFNWSYFPIVDESRELVRGENLDSATFSPHLRPGRLALSLALLLIGIVVTARSLASTASARKL